MKRTFKALLLLSCHAAALTLTACHTDTDPWPVNDAPLAQQSAQPTEEAAQQPASTQQPQPAQTPGGEEDPGLNG